jgi:hypothetical protein
MKDEQTNDTKFQMPVNLIQKNYKNRKSVFPHTDTLTLSLYQLLPVRQYTHIYRHQ